jgi:hypothetical protein
MKMVLWTSDKRTNSRRGVLTLLLLACVAAFLSLAPIHKAQALTDPKIGSWNPPTYLTPDTYYEVHVVFDAPVSQSTYVTVGGYGVQANTIWVAAGASSADVGVWTPEFGGGNSLSLSIGVTVNNGPGQPSENRETDSDNAQALWAD